MGIDTDTVIIIGWKVRGLIGDWSWVVEWHDFPQSRKIAEGIYMVAAKGMRERHHRYISLISPRVGQPIGLAFMQSVMRECKLLHRKIAKGQEMASSSKPPSIYAHTVISC